jgi:hypothetical protein
MSYIGTPGLLQAITQLYMPHIQQVAPDLGKLHTTYFTTLSTTRLASTQPKSHLTYPLMTSYQKKNDGD